MTIRVGVAVVAIVACGANGNRKHWWADKRVASREGEGPLRECCGRTGCAPFADARQALLGLARRLPAEDCADASVGYCDPVRTLAHSDGFTQTVFFYDSAGEAIAGMIVSDAGPPTICGPVPTCSPTLGEVFCGHRTAK